MTKITKSILFGVLFFTFIVAAWHISSIFFIKNESKVNIHNVYYKFSNIFFDEKYNSGRIEGNNKIIDGYINKNSDIEKNIELFTRDNSSVANTPYDYKINMGSNDKKKNKKKFYSRMLRSRIYNPWDPIVYISSNKEESNEELNDFLKKNALDAVTSTFDGQGFRKTVPFVDSDRIFIVLGDSVAYGLNLDDEETISSQLQQRFDQVRFINDGVGGGTPLSLRKRLKQHLDMFGEKVIGLIYIQTESDYNSNNTPETIIKPLVDIISKFDNLKYRALVHQQYIYQTMPDFFRGKFTFNFGNKDKTRGRSEDELIEYNLRKKEMLKISSRYNFFTVDFNDIVQRYRKEKKTTLAGFSLYVDQCHFSKEGISLIVNELDDSIENYLTRLER